jgi:hypothetical protein
VRCAPVEFVVVGTVAVDFLAVAAVTEFVVLEILDTVFGVAAGDCVAESAESAGSVEIAEIAEIVGVLEAENTS